MTLTTLLQQRWNALGKEVLSGVHRHAPGQWPCQLAYIRASLHQVRVAIAPSDHMCLGS